jgi:hypothetical protein
MRRVGQITYSVIQAMNALLFCRHRHLISDFCNYVCLHTYFSFFYLLFYILIKTFPYKHFPIKKWGTKYYSEEFVISVLDQMFNRFSFSSQSTLGVYTYVKLLLSLLLRLMVSFFDQSTISKENCTLIKFSTRVKYKI